jgi:sensor histidine kinase YesM
MLPFISVLLLISIPIMAYILKKMLEAQDEKQKNMLMGQQVKLQLKHMKNVEKFYLNIKKVIHDINNHISCLRSLADNNNLNEIKEYLHNIGSTVSNLDFKIKTGNPISDAVINEKFNISESENINFICDFMLPPKISIETIDLCIILSNALDNAIEACRNVADTNIQKKISIKSYIRDLYLIIEVSNTTKDKVKYVNNKIVSSKPNAINHGIGISNIEDVAKKYNGILDIIEEKNYFTLSVMLNI